MGLYAGLYKLSCDMCGDMGKRPTKTVIHKDGSRVDICSVFFSKCQEYPKFNQGIKDGDIRVVDY